MSLLVAASAVLIASPASAATVYEITARWAEGTPTEVASGDVVTAEWRVNVNDDAAAPANEPVDDVDFSVTIDHGLFRSLPDACLVDGVTPASSISADGKTLVCNLGTQQQGTAQVVQTPIEADGATGDRITAVGSVEGGTASVPEIGITNPFGMDMVWQSPTNGVTWADGHVDIDVQWSLFMHKGSDAGPDTVSYTLDVSNVVGAPISVGPQACSPFTDLAATGHPWSGGNRPADQTAPFVGSCTLTPTGTPGQFTLTLTGIDYSRVQVPTKDSTGRLLPADREAVASGSVWFRFASGANNSMTLSSSAPTYVSASGATFVDDASNNTSNKTWTRGGWSNAWQAEASGVQVPSWWSNEFRIAAGQTVQSTTTADWSSPDPNAVFGQCVVLDTRHIELETAQISHGWGGAPLPGVDVEYYVGTSPLVDASSGAYDPNAFRCGDDPGGWTTTPADTSDVKAVRALYPFSAMTGNPRASLNVRQMIKADTPVGTDVWQWGAAYANGQWVHPNRSMDPADRTGPLTPDTRYPFIGSGRDVLYIIGVQPGVTKSVDRVSVKPGIPANYTLTYTASGTGAIAETVDGFELVDTLPLGMSYVGGSANPEPAVSVNGSGQQVLTWTLDGVPTNTPVALTYQAVADASVTPGQALTNSVTAAVGGATSTPSMAQVTVSTNGFTQIGKTTDQWFIANPEGSGDGEGSWTVTLRSEDPLPQAFTDTIDILPYNGDGRGTDFAGTYEVTSVEVPAGATVYYTDEEPAALSDDPNAQGNGAAGAPSARWKTEKPERPTAIRVIGGELAPGASFAFKVNIATQDAEPGDTYVNRAQAIAEHTELVMRTSEPLTMGTFYSSSLKKYVQNSDGDWVDANDASEYPRFRVGETVNYRIVVVNTGQGTIRDLEVRDDLQPELGSFVIEELLPGEEHAYVKEYAITLEAGSPGTVVNSACASAPRPDDSEDPVQVNCDPAGFEVDGAPAHTKELVSATPAGDGRWELVYGIDVTNTSEYPTSYSLDDTLRFTDQASVVSAQVTAAPDGVTLADPAWNGQDRTRIASEVPLPGSGDDAYAPHRYEVTVVAEVPLHLEGAGSDADPAACPADGSDASRGFNNTSALTDARGDVEDDQACAPIPSLEITKSLDGAPVRAADGTWTVDYEVTVRNTGAAEGEYTLTDRLRYGAGIDVETARVTESPEGVELAQGWTGRGAEGADENVVASGVLAAGDAHTYRVRVTAALDTERADATTLACPAPDADGRGGFANTAGVGHNGLTGTATACEIPEWPEDVPPPLATTGATISPLIGGGVLLLLAGGLLLARRRRAPIA